MKNDAQEEKGIELKQITPGVNDFARVYSKTQRKNISSIFILKKMGRRVKPLIVAKDPLNVARGEGIRDWELGRSRRGAARGRNQKDRGDDEKRCVQKRCCWRINEWTGKT